MTFSLSSGCWQLKVGPPPGWVEKEVCPSAASSNRVLYGCFACEQSGILPVKLCQWAALWPGVWSQSPKAVPKNSLCLVLFPSDFSFETRWECQHLSKHWEIIIIYNYLTHNLPGSPCISLYRLTVSKLASKSNLCWSKARATQWNSPGGQNPLWHLR